VLPPPAAPSDLTASSASSTSIHLSWHDNSSNETGFAIEQRSPLNEYQVVQITGPGVSSVTLTGLASGVPATFRVQARNDQGASAYSGEASATPVAPVVSTCVSADDTLCLLADRFQVRVQWRNQHSPGEHGIGHAAPFPGSTKTGTFWFFNDANVELIVKALDGETVNGNFWLFYGALSDVEYWVTVVDTATGGSKTYYNQPSEICGVPDTAAFPGDVPSAEAPAPLALGPSATLAVSQDVSDPCQADAQTLCLLGRFQVRVEWTDQRTGNQGVGMAVPGTEKSGYFWFFNAQNVELVVKTLDNRVNAGNFWFFYGALSDVVYTITVRDTVTGLVKPYSNPAGGFCGQADTVGFPDPM
jgi:Fibronectin type III domain